MTLIDDDIERLRRFSRFFTQRIGVLNDRYLGLSRPLSESRLLFEIGTGGTDVRRLRSVLGLDSGYMSRLLRSLESQGLVRVAADPADSRARVVALTPAGEREVGELDRRAADVARGLVAPLTAGQLGELGTALDRVERLLRLSTITLEVVDPLSVDARTCLAAYAEELRRRFPHGFDDGDLVPPDHVRGAPGAVVVAREQGRSVGCGVVRTHAPGIGEIRHLWVDGAARGLGLGRRLLAELERQAVLRGHRVVRLDTNEVLTEAIALYRSSGYEQVPPYDDNPHASFWFEKDLVAEDGPAERG
jgi:DNA-binding MarR family transcriptional regulator/ribosomal protein S18 acetylase RimI-like enzyme